MLVLTRKIDEAIIIGDNIKITVLDIRSDSVKLGIDAPKEVPILRDELLTRKLKPRSRTSPEADD